MSLPNGVDPLDRLRAADPARADAVPDASLAGLKAALAAGKVKRFAIANPEVAPYGQRAVEALTHAGLWDAVKPRLVMGENIAQAAQFATSGSTQGARRVSWHELLDNQ